MLLCLLKIDIYIVSDPSNVIEIISSAAYTVGSNTIR